MRVLIVTPALPRPEQPNSMAPLIDQLESLRSRGVHFQILEISGRKPLFNKLAYVLSIPMLWQRLKHVDLIHAHHGYCGWVALCQRKRPVLVSFMGEDLLGMPNRNGNKSALSRSFVWLNRHLMRHMNGVIVKSAEMANAASPTSVNVIANGVDTDKFKPMLQPEARGHLGWNPEDFYVLFGADPNNTRKNYALAQAVIARLQKQLAKPIHLVSLTGILHMDVPIYMNGCNAMIFTSLLEGSPNVVKEAMACNLPVVSVPVGDAPELFAEVPGYEVCPYNANLLAESLLRILSTEDVLDNGREAIYAKGLTLDSVAERIHTLYQSLIVL